MKEFKLTQKKQKFHYVSASLVHVLAAAYDLSFMNKIHVYGFAEKDILKELCNASGITN